MTNSTNKRASRYISRADAARTIGISKQSIAYLLKQGRFRTITMAGRVFILRADAEKYLAHSKRRTSKGSVQTRKPNKKLGVVQARVLTADFITQAEAARIRGVSQQAIANLIHRGRLKPTQIAGRTLVLRSEVEAFVPKPKLGRPPKKKTVRKKKTD